MRSYLLGLISPYDRVHEALHTWGKQIFIVQAGASVASGRWTNRNDRGGFHQLSLDDSGVDMIAACLRPQRSDVCVG